MTACGLEHLPAELLRFELLSGYHVESTYSRASEIEQAAAARNDMELMMRARLVRADSLERRGDTTAGARLASGVARWAERTGHHFLLARAHRHLSSVYYNLGDTAACLQHALQSVELLDDAAPAPFRARHIGALADALGWSGQFEEARERYRAALEIHTREHDVHGILTTLNNLAYTECDADEPQRAWAVAERMRAVARAEGWPLGADDLDTIARIQIGLADYAAAEETMREALASVHSQPYQEAHGTVEVLLTLAEIQRLRADLTAAQRTLDECRQLCEQRQLGEIRVRVLQEQAQLYAAAGSFEQAYETHRLFYVAEKELRDAERVAQVNTRIAMFETAEARQEARRFQEMALRDQLTGLHNRRHLDAQLPAVLAEATAAGRPVTAALIDVDHFKRINDRYGHDAGDRVLCTVAGLLRETVRQEDVLARWGGEEFLILAPYTDETGALLFGERVRSAIAADALPVSDTVGVTITVSVGVATGVTAGGEDLIRRADAALYHAKAAGRDRVALDGG